MKIPNPFEHPVCLSYPPLLTDSAWLEHIPFAFFIVDLIRPRIFVELGTHTGLSYSAFCESVKKIKINAKCYAIDTWSGDEHAGYYDHNVLKQLRKFHDPAYRDFSELIQGTFDEAVGRFANGTIDLLHIDGLHTYEAVKHDFETWLPKLSNRSVVLFHDTNVREGNFGVWKLWEELQKKHPNFEFFHGYGLGVLKVGTETTSIDSLFDMPEEATVNFREFFSLLGKQIYEKKEIQTLKVSLSEQDTRILERDAQLAERDAQLAERDAQLAERDAQLAERDAQLAERDAQVKSLTQKILKITKSRSWFFTSLSLRIENWLLPDGSWQVLLLDKIAKKMELFFDNRKIKDDLTLLSASSFYDETWYLKNYPDVDQKNIAPTLHYLLYGGFEKRDPGLQFCSQWYLEAYPDVLLADYNPLIHYLKFGQKEGRRILPSHIPVSKFDSPDVPLITEVEREWQTNGMAASKIRKPLSWKTSIGKFLQKIKNSPRKMRGWYYSISVNLKYPYQYMKANGLKKTLVAIIRKILNYFRRLIGNVLHKDEKVEHVKMFLDYSRENLPLQMVEKRERPKNVLFISADADSTTTLKISGILQKFVQKIESMRYDDGDYSVPYLSKFQPAAIILHRTLMTGRVKDLLIWAKRNYVPILYVLESEIQGDLVTQDEVEKRKVSDQRLINQSLYEVFHACDYILCTNDIAFKWAERNNKTSLKYDLDSATVIELGQKLDEIEKMYRRRHLPKFSVISILHGKAEQIESVLHSYFRQSYPGEFELIFIDDQSLDQSVEVVEGFVASARKNQKYRRIPEVKILRNEHNLGNCISRNQGIKAASGDIIIVNDADCMVNKDFLKGHADAHSFDDCDVVIGPYNIETNNREPLLALEEFEENPELAVSESHLQDPINPRSFVNCVTRNFSIKSNFITEDLFDSLFTYSRDPESGFGWEDVEMGYRLYKNGARIKYSTTSFSIHISHPSGMDEALKPYRSLKNFRRLFEKHPEILYVARRWSLDTYNKILEWLRHYDLPENDDQRFLDRMFKRFQPAPFYIKTKKRLKILTYRWHVPHQYELYKLPHEFTLLTDLGSGMTRIWDLRQRPLPNNVKLRSICEIDPKNYDVAILHFDENVLAPENTNGVIGGDWGKSFQWLYKNLNMPKVAVCHGTPQFFGQFEISYKTRDASSIKIIEEERKRFIDYLEDTLVIINSYQAQREWDFNRSKVVWHGFDPSEFPIATYEKGIVSPFGPLVLSRPHYRGFFLYEDVFKDFPAQYLPATLYVPEPDIMYSGNEYALGKFQNYMRELSRFSVYFNPTLRSPMPRARGEAMLCGLVAVSATNHDVELFIKNGWNGFFSNDPEELRNYLLYLMKNPLDAQRIGIRGRDTAMDVFNHDRYLAEWENIFTDLIG